MGLLLVGEAGDRETQERKKEMSGESKREEARGRLLAWHERKDEMQTVEKTWVEGSRGVCSRVDLRAGLRV